ncbi:MAG: HisA/HisF-related TIM barrel protein, partial [Candidatus Margulisiibacteriota bacterium]
VETDLAEFLRNLVKTGAKRIVLTDISKDGAMQGPNFELMREVCEAIAIPVIASGGVTTQADIDQLATIPGVEGCIVGKALYEGTIKLTSANI